MAAQIIDGKAIAEQVREEIKAQVAQLATSGVKPGVATILVGEDGGAQFYRGQIEKNTGTVGFKYYNHTLPAGASEAEILDLIAKLNADDHVHGILALMPMDAQIDQNTVFNAIAPEKDLDCVNPANIGHVLLGDQLFAPATPSACIEILDREGIELAPAARASTSPSSTTRTSSGSRWRCSASTATPRSTSCTCSARTSRRPAARPTCSSAPRRCRT